MTQAELEEVKQVEGWLIDAEIEFLYEQARKTEEGCIVEIGNYRGKSTVALALGSEQGSSAPIYTIDPHKKWKPEPGGHQFGPEDRKSFLRTLVNRDVTEIVRPIELDSHVPAGNWEKPVGFLWIDGDHSYEGCKRDVVNWKPHLISGSVIAFHDYTKSHLEGLRKVANTLKDSSSYEQIDKFGSILALKKL